MEHLPYLLREYTLSPHSLPKPRVIQLAAPHGSDPIQDLSLPPRLVAVQPFLEYGRDSERKAQDFHPGPSGADLPGLHHHRRYLVVVQPRDYRRNQHPDRYSGLGQRLHSGQSVPG